MSRGVARVALVRPKKWSGSLSRCGKQQDNAPLVSFLANHGWRITGQTVVANCGDTTH